MADAAAACRRAKRKTHAAACSCASKQTPPPPPHRCCCCRRGGGGSARRTLSQSRYALGGVYSILVLLKQPSQPPQASPQLLLLSSRSSPCPHLLLNDIQFYITTNFWFQAVGWGHTLSPKSSLCVCVCVCHRPHIHVLCEGLLQLEVRCFSVVTPDRCFVCFLQPF